MRSAVLLFVLVVRAWLWADPLVKSVRIEGTSRSFSLETKPGEPFDAERIARDVRRLWATRLFDDIRVENRDTNEVVFCVTERRIRIGAVGLTGTTGVPSSEIEQALRPIRPRVVIPGLWTHRPLFSQEAVRYGIARVRSELFSNGYFDAAVRLNGIEQKANLAFVSIAIDPGDQYQLGKIEIVDEDKSAQYAPNIGGPLLVRNLCACLLDLRREAQEEGRIDFDTAITATGHSNKAVDLSVELRTGPRYTVGRIDFKGNRLVLDSTIRKALVIKPGRQFDLRALNRGLQHVDRMGLFEPLSSDSVRIVRRPELGSADVQIQLKDRPQRRWWLSGPAGPFRVGGPLNAAVSSRLPAWGKGILEGSTYNLTFSLLMFSNPLFIKSLAFAPQRTVFPVISLERPILPGQGWTSGFTIAPQLGWKGMAANTATTQLRSRLGDLVRGQTLAEPDIVSRVRRVKSGEDARDIGALMCERRGSRWSKLRSAGAMALDLALTGVP